MCGNICTFVSLIACWMLIEKPNIDCVERIFVLFCQILEFVFKSPNFYRFHYSKEKNAPHFHPPKLGLSPFIQHVPCTIPNIHLNNEIVSIRGLQANDAKSHSYVLKPHTQMSLFLFCMRKEKILNEKMDLKHRQCASVYDSLPLYSNFHLKHLPHNVVQLELYEIKYINICIIVYANA